MQKEFNFIAKARKNGSSLIITIPKNICNYFKIKEGEDVCLKIEGEIKEKTKR